MLDTHSLKEYISGELGLDGVLGYYNQSIANRLMRRQENDKTFYQNPLVQQLYILVEHRLRNTLSIPDKGRKIEELRLKEPSAIAILSILGEIGSDPTMLKHSGIKRRLGWKELKALVNQHFDPQIRAYLSSLLPTITSFFDLLSFLGAEDIPRSVDISFPPQIDIFKDSNHNLSSFIQN